jgi:hypothetical protein
MQNLFRKNPAEAARQVMENRWDLSECQNMVNEKELSDEWSRIIGAAPVNDSRPVIAKSPPISQLEEPISDVEVEMALKAMKASAPGPDGLQIRNIREVPTPILSCIFNLCLALHHLPARMKIARTILIPKVKNPSAPGDFRPISMTSVLTRLFHKILAKRLERHLPFNPRQKGFFRSDGCAENLHLLNAILHAAKKGKKPVTILFIDIRKAFDSLSHDTLFRCALRLGVPVNLVEYIKASYNHATTTLLGNDITSYRGVRQGDPLSPILFNCVIDEALDSLNKSIGVSFGGIKVSALAFADDLVLIAESPQAAEVQLKTLMSVLRDGGLELNSKKCATLILKVDKKRKKWYIGSDRIAIDGEPIPTMSPTDGYKYLGIHIKGISQPANIREELCKVLTSTSKAPLKPQQRLFILRRFIIPRFIYTLTFSNILHSTLRNSDKLLRKFIRQWLHLPHDTSDAFIHAPIPSGGLGIPALRLITPNLRLNRVIELGHSRDPVIQAICQTEYFREISRKWGIPQLVSSIPVTSKSSAADAWSTKLLLTRDGKGLHQHKLVPQAHSWVSGSLSLPSKDFIQFIRLRGNLMPTRTRQSRGIGDKEQDSRCSAGCNDPESLSHILQRCYKTSGLRILRHNNIVKLVAEKLKEKQWEVSIEPQIRTSFGLRKPDLVLHKNNLAVILDVQIVSDSKELKESHELKVSHYNVQEIVGWVKGNTGADNVLVSSITVNWRGAVCRESAIFLSKILHLPLSTLNLVSRYALSGGVLIWRAFRDGTQSRIHRRANNILSSDRQRPLNANTVVIQGKG